MQKQFQVCLHKPTFKVRKNKFQSNYFHFDPQKWLYKGGVLYLALILTKTENFVKPKSEVPKSKVQSPKSKVPKSRPKGLGLTPKSHGPAQKINHVDSEIEDMG